MVSFSVSNEGRRLEIRVSTRVPEKLYGKKIEGMKVYYDNSKLVKECDVVIICTPKHKNKYVFSSI
jgi:3-hydroxyisobutyrate dehydrogenase-like beta-hydroxyacid dehydrogenase